MFNHPTTGQPLSAIDESRRRLETAKDRDDFYKAGASALVAIAHALTRIADQFEDNSRYPSGASRR